MSVNNKISAKMSGRDYYKVTFSTDVDPPPGSSEVRTRILDNDTEFNANQFKLYDDFTTDLRISFNTSGNYHQAVGNWCAKRRVDPDDSGVDMENGNPLDDSTNSNHTDLLENEVMVDPWSSMDSSNSPLTDSGPSASDDCTPSTSSEPTHEPIDLSSPLSPDTNNSSDPKAKCNTAKHIPPKILDKARPRNLDLDLEILEPDPLPRRPHFLDEDFQHPSRTNIECRIPKPHFLDHSPSPDEFDERSDITNPNFLDDDVDGDDNQAKKSGALPKRPLKTSSSTFPLQEERLHRTSYRSTLHYGLENAARSSERDKRASQLYRGTWPGERDTWIGHDTASVRSFSSNGSTECPRPSSTLENKMECVCSLISLLSLSPENNADLSGPLLDMSRSVESCIAMRQAGCIPLLVQLIHSKVPRETRHRASKALRNIIHTQTDDKAGRREARVWRLLEQVREYCYVLEDIVEARKEGKETIDDDATKHPSQSVAALMKLSFDEEHRHVVCQLGGLQALAALVSGDQAAHGSRTDDNTCLTMRKYAGMTLTNLTFGDGNNKSLLCSFKDFMVALVEQLESPNDDMRQVTAAVLRNLSWRADTNSKQVLREVGAVKGLTKAAMTCQKEATLKSVLSALWNLTAHCSMNKVALCSVDGALGFLVDMLSYDSPTKTLAIIENAGGIMRNVSSHIAVREDYRQILRERNCLSVLLQHLKSPSLTVVSNSCGTLWNLSARCPHDQQFLWDRGAVPMLRSLIHSKHKMIAMGSSAALKNLLNSKPGKTHIISLDTTARTMNLPALPTLGARKQKALEQELDQNLAETCDNIEPATSPSTSNREEKNLFTATERQISMNLERHRMTSSSPLMGNLTSQISLSHSAHLASYLSCSNTLLKGALVSRSTGASTNNVNRSDSKDSVTSTHSDSVFERVMRTGKVPVPTPRSRDLLKDTGSEAFKISSTTSKDSTFYQYANQPPIPPPRSTTDMRTNYTESGFDVDHDSCDQPIDYSRKYSETKTNEPEALVGKTKSNDGKKYAKKENPNTFGEYQETDLDQPTDYSLRYAEHQSENGSDSEPPGPSINEDTIQHFATEGTPYETPIIFSTATSMSDLRVIGKESKPKTAIKENPEVMTHSDEKDTCSIEDPPRHDNDRAATTPQTVTVAEPIPEKRGVFDTKFSSGMISPEKPINYCDEGTPGYFSGVSSLSSLGEPTEEDSLAKKNAMATINVEPGLQEQIISASSKDKEGSKAVTFASDKIGTGTEPGSEGVASARTASPAPRFIEDTPLMFSRSSSLGSLPECEHHDDQGSVLSEVSRLTSGCISPSEIPDSPGGSAPLSPLASSRRACALHTPPAAAAAAEAGTGPVSPPESGEGGGAGVVGGGWVFAERVRRFEVEDTPAQFSARTSLSSLTIDTDTKQSLTTSPPKSAPAPDEMLASPSQHADTHPRHDTRSGEDVPTCSGGYPNEVFKDGGADGGGGGGAVRAESPSRRRSSDSSALSDAAGADLLEECIQKGIAKAVKNKGPGGGGGGGADSSPTRGVYAPRHDPYRSLPPHLHASTETIKLSHSHHLYHSLAAAPQSGSSSAPPLPPKSHTGHHHHYHQPHHHTQGDKQTSSSPSKSERGQREGREGGSLSSLSLDSFGSTDREIFEETVQAGLCSVATTVAIPRGKAHSVERAPLVPTSASAPPGMPRPRARARSLDRRDRHELRLDRSGSGSSLSNESFGSTDKEVFERCVRAGMSRRHAHQRRTDALHRMAGAEYSRDRAILEEVIARGAGDAPPHQHQHPPTNHPHQQQQQQQQPKNVPAPSAASAPAGGASGDLPAHTGCDREHEPTRSETSGSNECLAPHAHTSPSADTTLHSEPRDELNLSNESYADVLDGDGLLSDADNDVRLEWVDIKRAPQSQLPPPPLQQHVSHEESSRPLNDTWNDDTCPDDVTFPTISGSVHMISSLPSETLPDLLERSDVLHATSSRPDLTSRLHGDLETSQSRGEQPDRNTPPDERQDLSFACSMDNEMPKLDSIVSSAIEREAARLAAQLRCSQYAMENSATSLASVDLNNVAPPSHMGSLLSLSASGQWDEPSNGRKSQRSRKKSLPVALMVRRALSNSQNHGSSECLDSNPVSLLDNVKPPSEMENVDMESSMVSVSSIVSEVAEMKDKTPVVFDLKQPIQGFPLCSVFGDVYHDLDKVNPPSLFEEMTESTIEVEQTTAQHIYEECGSDTLIVVTDIPSGSENCTPLPSDLSSVESTPKRRAAYLTPKEKRIVSKDRYQTYTISDTVEEDDITLEVDNGEFLTWTKSESDRSDDYFTGTSEAKSRKKVSAKQRRLEDRARYQTQTVDINNIFCRKKSESTIDSLKQRLASKKTMKQKRLEDAERFRTRTLSEDIPPSPTFVTKDANFENVETTTGYDSLSSNETGHQQIMDEGQRDDDVFSRDADSGHNEDDFELNSTQMQTYTKSFRNYLPVIESPSSVDMCVVNNLKNIEMTASYRLAMHTDKHQNPSSSDFASYEGDSDRAPSDSEPSSAPVSRPKPKIIKPGPRRGGSLDSNDSQDNEQEGPKCVRGRKKTAYVSPYRRNVTNPKKSITPTIKAPKTPATKPIANEIKTQTCVKTLSKTTPSVSKTPSANTSPKKTLVNRSPIKSAQHKSSTVTPSKPLPLERQSTFTKEESTVPAKNLPMPDKMSNVARYSKATSPKKSGANISPSRLPQLNRYGRTPAQKTNSNETKTYKTATKKAPQPTMRNSASNHSLQSNESGKTVTLTPKGSRQGSTSSVNSTLAAKTKDVESKIANLWKKVEQTKKQSSKSDRRVWIESDKTEPPKLIRSSTFEGQPKSSQVSSAPKQKSAIAIKVSQIPSLRPKSASARPSNTSAKKPANSRALARKPTNGQVIT